MLYSRTHMATVSVKVFGCRLIRFRRRPNDALSPRWADGRFYGLFCRPATEAPAVVIIDSSKCRAH